MPKTTKTTKGPTPPPSEAKAEDQSAIMRAGRGCEDAAKEVAATLAESPEAVASFEAMEHEGVAQWIITRSRDGCNPAIRESRLAVHRLRCQAYAGPEPTAVASSLAQRCALYQLELESIEARIRSLSDKSADEVVAVDDDDDAQEHMTDSMRSHIAASVKVTTLAWLEGRREISEKRFMSALRSLAEMRRVLSVVHIHETKAREEARALKIADVG